jgi:hypothetical protein
MIKLLSIKERENESSSWPTEQEYEELHSSFIHFTFDKLKVLVVNENFAYMFAFYFETAVLKRRIEKSTTMSQ